MFGFQGGEAVDIVLRKRSYMRDAQQRWDLQNCVDLPAIRSQAQLIALLQERLGLPLAQIKCDVESWMEGKRF
jgi:hypothetical protein